MDNKYSNITELIECYCASDAEKCLHEGWQLLAILQHSSEDGEGFAIQHALYVLGK